MDLPSKLLEKTVEHFQSLPGVGRRTALRYTLQLLKLPKEDALKFGQSIMELVNGLGLCKNCFNISDEELCRICSHPKRESTTICVVEDLRDLLALEGTGQYNGVYHVLGGVISPLDGVGPGDLRINELLMRIDEQQATEVIFALPATTEGDTTCFYLYKKLASYDVATTSLARGVAVGNELQYTDQITLGRSLMSRLPYENSISKS